MASKESHFPTGVCGFELLPLIANRADLPHQDAIAEMPVSASLSEGRTNMTVSPLDHALHREQTTTSWGTRLGPMVKSKGKE